MQTRSNRVRGRGEDGKGSLGCLVSILLAGAAILIGVRVGPPYFAYKGLEGDVKTEVSRAGARFFGNEVVKQNILDVARKNEVRLKDENVRVERFAGQIHVVVEYSVPVDLFVTQHTFDFKIKASSFVGTL
jgi:hypothetical protein